MKKILTLIGLMIIVACSVMAMTSCDNTDWGEGDGDPSLLEYKLSDDGTYYIVAGIGDYVGTHLVIPEEYKGLPVKEIGIYAFSRRAESNYDIEALSALKAITISDSVTSLGFSVFAGSSIERINIGSGLSTIRDGAFVEAANIAPVSLREINVSKDNQSYMSKSGVLYSKDGSELIKYPPQKTATRFRISNKVKIISEYAFEEAANLRSVKIGKNVASIGESAFDGAGIRKIKIPNSVKVVDVCAFTCCENLKKVKIGSGLTEISPLTFLLCESLEKIVIPQNIKAIRGGAFSNCEKLKTVFYEGNKEEWDKVEIDAKVNLVNYEDVFPDDTQIYTYSKKRPGNEGNYWRYIFWVPTVWKK